MSEMTAKARRTNGRHKRLTKKNILITGVTTSIGRNLSIICSTIRASGDFWRGPQRQAVLFRRFAANKFVYRSATFSSTAS
jgi:hypothetical protein